MTFFVHTGTIGKTVLAGTFDWLDRRVCSFFRTQLSLQQTFMKQWEKNGVTDVITSFDLKIKR